MRACVVTLGLLAEMACIPCSTVAPLWGLDGGAVACVQATDCPRTGTLVCGSQEDRLIGCVDCVEARCVQFTRGACP